MSNTKLCELCYGGVVIAFSPQPETLLLEKCEMVLNSSVRYPQLLKIYWHDGTEWILDEKMTKKRASCILYERFHA